MLISFIFFSPPKEWYLKFVKEECYSHRSPAKECAHLLSQLKFEDITAIMSSKEFQLPILEQCLILGAKCIATSEKYKSSKSDDPFVGVTESAGSILYRSAQSTLLQHLTDFMALLPRTSKFQNRLYKLFSDKSFWELLFVLVSTTTCYLKTLHFIPARNIPYDSLDDIAILSIVSCEAVVFIIQSAKSLSSEMLKLTLLMLDECLKNAELSAVIGSEKNMSWICSAIFAVHLLVKYLQQDKEYPMVVYPFNLEDCSLTHEQCLARKACIHIVELISWLESYRQFQLQISEHLFCPIKSVIQGMARLPIINSFARTPPILWQLRWCPEFCGSLKTSVPPPPGEYLQDRDVLKQYIYRINLLGWTSRQQFEETWMALLGVLSATPVDDVDGKEEDQERIRTSCLAVKSITSLLLQTLLLPQPGNPQNSTYLKQPRDKPLAFQHTKCGKKLMCVRLPIHIALQNILQFER
ncbi:huntingtin-like [Stegodyphus dumicola]|uniref:huntingtin-like n=1 Tax=Stegodyphus dumicola TaxID=202533 RepID=UPI0015AC8445|nr:huntingtin-like [Stegodyphus dumicola]